MKGSSARSSRKVDPSRTPTWSGSTARCETRFFDGTEARFERDGSPVAGNPPAFTEPLLVRPVITAWNGNLLVNVRSIEGWIAEHAWP